MSETAAPDNKCRGCHTEYIGNNLNWFYFQVANEYGMANTSGPYCEDCYKRGVTVSGPATPA